MINLRRDPPAPASLAKKSFEGVREILFKMSHDKSYICEQKHPSSSEIEHFISKAKHPDLEYEWENLFMACHHCNSIKNYTIDSKEKEILNVTDFTRIVTDEILFICSPEPKEKIKIEAISISSKDEVLVNTIELLDNVFNATTPAKQFDSKALTDKVIRAMKGLLDLLHEYEYDANSPERKAEIKSKIRDNVSIYAPFTAFKIQYIQRVFPEMNELLPIFEK